MSQEPNGAAHAPHAARGAGAPRVSVAFTFYRLRPEVFSVPAEERQRLAEEFEDVVDDASDHLGLLRTYSLVGLRGDADLLLWQAADKPDGLQQFAAQLRRAGLYRYLEVAHQYLAMTRRSIYVNDHVHEGQDGTRTRVQPAGAPYLFVYPFVKTRPWYALPMEERQRMMSEHIATGHKYPSVKINTTYSFGIDDQEFVVAFEAENPSEFLDLVMELRSSAASAYTLRDTPAFTCVARPLGRALSLALGTATVDEEPVSAALHAELAASR
jgi:chlorite dismutase